MEMKTWRRIDVEREGEIEFKRWNAAVVTIDRGADNGR